MIADGQRFMRHINFDGTSTTDTGHTHAARNNRRVAGHAACTGQNAN